MCFFKTFQGFHENLFHFVMNAVECVMFMLNLDTYQFGWETKAKLGTKEPLLSDSIFCMGLNL